MFPLLSMLSTGALFTAAVVPPAPAVAATPMPTSAPAPAPADPEAAAHGVALNNQGHALAQSGRYAQAVDLYLQALPLLTGDDARTAANRAATLNNLGAALATVDDPAGAQQAFEEALQLREALFGPLAAPTLLSRHNLGVVLGRRGDLERACAQSRLAWHGRVQTLGPEHPDTLASLAALQGCTPA